VTFLRALLLLLVLGMPVRASAAPPAGAGWNELREAPFTFWSRDEDTILARQLADASAKVLEGVTRRTGLPAPRKIDVVLASSADAFAAAQPGEPPSWAAGTAWSERSEIYLRTRLPRRGPSNLQQVFTHEVVHIVLGRAWTHGSPPRWLNEGVSKYLAGEMRPGEHATLARAAAGGSLLSMETFTEGWPSRAAQARLAYVQSVDFVAFLARQGDDVLPTVIGSMASGASLDAALISATGDDLATQEERWRSRVTLWHALIPVLGSSGTFWGIGAVLFLFAAVKRRRAFHTKVAELEEAERLRAILALE
jgi:hypothetical protein